jgi:hypothetical protein
MNCAHCGSALATLLRDEDGHFCSEEHREAYLCANDSSKPARESRNTGKVTKTRKAADNPAPLSSTYFLLTGLPDNAPRPIGLNDCEPDPFPLGVIAPASHIQPTTPLTPGFITMPMPRVRAWTTAVETEPVPATARSKPRIPKGPLPFPATALRKAGMRSVATGQLTDSARPASQPWMRWVALAVCFLGVAVITRLAMSEKGSSPQAAANQGPVAAFEDFSGGLSRWAGAEGGARPWTLLDARGASPNSLALFAPSRGMTDYRLEFTADVEKNGLSWAVHATDPKNYHALQIWQKRAGAEAQLWLTRYAVSGGREGPRTQVPLQIQFPAQPVWLIRMEVTGESCTLWVENQIANAWSEVAVPNSSVGFFAGKSDQFVLKRVRITPQ